MDEEVLIQLRSDNISIFYNVPFTPSQYPHSGEIEQQVREQIKM